MWLVVAFPTAMLAMLMVLAVVEARWLDDQPRQATPLKQLVQQPWQASFVPVNLVNPADGQRTEVHAA